MSRDTGWKNRTSRMRVWTRWLIIVVLFSACVGALAACGGYADSQGKAHQTQTSALESSQQTTQIGTTPEGCAVYLIRTPGGYDNVFAMVCHTDHGPQGSIGK